MKDTDIKQAFDTIEPTEDALSRMLENIMDTHEQKESDHKDEGNTSTTPTPSIHAIPRPIKKIPVWKATLPIAASLIILAGIGAFTLSQQTPLESAVTESESAISTKSLSDAPLSDEAPEDSAAGLVQESSDIDTIESLSTHNKSSADSSLPQNYPLIESPTLGRMYIVDNGESEASLADETQIGDRIEDATAKDITGENTITCTIYEYPSSEIGHYALRYEGEETYYIAATLAR